jgi:hypothetical protein
MPGAPAQRATTCYRNWSTQDQTGCQDRTEQSPNPDTTPPGVEELNPGRKGLLKLRRVLVNPVRFWRWRRMVGTREDEGR